MRELIAIILAVIIIFWLGYNCHKEEVKDRGEIYIDKGCTVEQQQAIEIVIFNEVQL